VSFLNKSWTGNKPVFRDINPKLTDHEVTETVSSHDPCIENLKPVESFREDIYTGSGPLGDFYVAVRLQDHGIVNNIFSKVS